MNNTGFFSSRTTQGSPCCLSRWTDQPLPHYAIPPLLTGIPRRYSSQQTTSADSSLGTRSTSHILQFNRRSRDGSGADDSTTQSVCCINSDDGIVTRMRGVGVPLDWDASDGSHVRTATSFDVSRTIGKQKRSRERRGLQRVACSTTRSLVSCPNLNAIRKAGPTAAKTSPSLPSPNAKEKLR